MSSLKLLLGLIPSTTKIEQADKALNDEFEKLKTFTDSALLAKYTELHDLVNSSSFLQNKKDIESLQYKSSEEFRSEKEFLSLQKSKDIVQYFKTVSGSFLSRFKELDGSQKIRDFEELETFIKSNTFRQKQKMKPITFKDSDEYRKFIEYKSMKSDPEIKAYLKSVAKGGIEKSKTVQKFEELGKFINSQEFLSKKNMRPITFKDTEEYKKLLEYDRLRKSPDITQFFKFKASKEYANFLNIDGSEKLARFNSLKEYVSTKVFSEKKAYLLDKKRFEKTEEYKSIQEYDKLKKNEDIIWYFKIKDSNKFDSLRNKQLTFYDDFTGDRIDGSKWITNHYWGDKLLKDNYSLESDLQAYTGKDNLEVRNSLLKIHTRPQKVTGKVWSPSLGFRTKEFGFTSGIISTGSSFRQKYGIFSAKIKLGNSNARNNFWLLSDKLTPHLDICRTSDGKVWNDYAPEPGQIFKSSIGSKYSDDFYIFTLEWMPDRLVWKINSEEIFRQTTHVPQVPMYVLFSGGLTRPVNGSTAMEIDWVKVYQIN